MTLKIELSALVAVNAVPVEEVGVVPQAAEGMTMFVGFVDVLELSASASA